MHADKNTIRLLGAVFLIVFFASLVSNTLLDQAVGSGSISERMVSVTDNLTLVRVSILVELVTSTGIIALACLLYIVFRDQHRIMATVALGWWLAEGITLGVSKLGAYALIPLSQDFVEAGAPGSGHFQSLGHFLYYGFDRQAWHLHMLFFSLGGILWYYLFLRCRYIPRYYALWGVASICLVFVNTLMVAYDSTIDPIAILLLPYVFFELSIGPWLIIKGINTGAEAETG
jgi:hypothetical protein